MKSPAASRRSPGFGGAGLPLWMLGIAGAGVLAGLLRAVGLEGPEWWRLAIWTPVLLAPVGVLAALAVGLARRRPLAAAWGGIGGALASV